MSGPIRSGPSFRTLLSREPRGRAPGGRRGGREERLRGGEVVDLGPQPPVEVGGLQEARHPVVEVGDVLFAPVVRTVKVVLGPSVALPFHRSQRPAKAMAARHGGGSVGPSPPSRRHS